MENTDKKQTQSTPIGPVRFSYLTVFKPRQNPNKEGVAMEYSVVLMIPKEPNQFCPDPKAIGKRISELVKETLAVKFKTTPAKWDNPLKDGDAETDGQGNAKHPGYWFVRAWCKDEFPPLLVDGGRNPVTGGWQSGDWGKVLINCYAYDQKGNKGVGVGLRGIQFLKHDEPLGVASVTPDAFDVEESDAPLSGSSEEDWDPFQD